MKLTGPEGIGLSADLRNADEGSHRRRSLRLFLGFGEAAANEGSGVVFLLDEVQFVEPDGIPRTYQRPTSRDTAEHADNRCGRRTAADPELTGQAR